MYLEITVIASKNNAEKKSKKKTGKEAEKKTRKNRKGSRKTGKVEDTSGNEAGKLGVELERRNI